MAGLWKRIRGGSAWTGGGEGLDRRAGAHRWDAGGTVAEGKGKRWKLGGLLLCLWGLAGCQLYAHDIYPRLKFAPGMPQTRVLMIGDSLTYYNDLPGLLQQLSAGEAAPIYIESVTFPYTSLTFHWDAGKAVDRIHQGHFDYVVLQDFSRRPATNPAESEKDFARFDAEIRRRNARTIIFENWTRRGMDDDFPALVGTYEQVVERTHATLAPIGAAFRDWAVAHGDGRLLVDDRHPNAAGTYLAACVLYDVIYHKPSAALPLGLTGPKMSPEVIRMLRTEADRTTGVDAGGGHAVLR